MISAIQQNNELRHLPACCQWMW